ncbi:unnamed protein product [Macrosiphum euphorbiae]|uniref:Uncharacterized protein n=1 Tax=Macrosiphum euphorbiae TaxID=13131 RepID=A0AAV0XWG6_9HEMI|nr:unnamed protein product [Macrosiphum euphorbiae]
MIMSQMMMFLKTTLLNQVQKYHKMHQIVHNPRNCMVCLTATPGEIVAQHIVPFGHAWVCETCVSVLDGQYHRTCPVLRGDVLRFQRMFLS